MREAGIDFEEHRIPLDMPDTAEQIAAFNAAGKVPVLITDELKVWDSLAICETVAEHWPEKRLWPDDPADRFTHREAFRLINMHTRYPRSATCVR